MASTSRGISSDGFLNKTYQWHKSVVDRIRGKEGYSQEEIRVVRQQAAAALLISGVSGTAFYGLLKWLPLQDGKSTIQISSPVMQPAKQDIHVQWALLTAQEKELVANIQVCYMYQKNDMPQSLIVETLNDVYGTQAALGSARANELLMYVHSKDIKGAYKTRFESVTDLMLSLQSKYNIAFNTQNKLYELYDRSGYEQ
jgi:hypothetical protein